MLLTRRAGNLSLTTNKTTRRLGEEPAAITCREIVDLRFSAAQVRQFSSDAGYALRWSLILSGGVGGLLRVVVDAVRRAALYCAYEGQRRCWLVFRLEA